ncbi:MAG: hypothetical protein KUG61_10525, partial [Parvibaculaceae bacterium]|nr:hypothetical protein [Parvibaculaceae bacterium]
VNARGVTATGTAATTQASEYTILREAFSREQGIEADMVDLDPSDGSKGVFLVEISEINEPAERLLEDVKPEITTAWTQEKRLEKAAEIAEFAKTRLAAGEDAEAIALDLNATSFEAKNVARTGDNNSSLASNIRRLIFDLDQGVIDYERAADSDGYVVIRVEEVIPGEPATRTAAVDTLLTQLNTQVVDEIFIQYQGYLLKEFDISVNTVLQQSLFADTAQQ